MKDKLISFPDEILETLEEYRQKTGIPATDYIRRAVIKQMIVEGLIFIKMKYIYVDKQSENNGKKLTEVESDNANKFCDGDKCEINPMMMKEC